MRYGNSDQRVEIIKDPTLNLELETFLSKIFNFFLVPILNHLPLHYKERIQKSSPSAEEVIKNKKNHIALEILYNKGKNSYRNTVSQHFFRLIWFHRDNAKGVRNRLKIVESLLKKEIDEKILHTNENIRILSIASGSARAVIESVQQYNEDIKKKLRLFFLDKNPEAINYSRNLFDKKLDGHVQGKWINATANSFPSHIEGKFHIIEMVGLLDYYNDEKAIQLFNTIYNNLADDGVLITANIMPNKEQRFVTHLIGWEMKYRTPDKLVSLIESAGFPPDKITAYIEPIKIHCIIIAKK